MSQLNQKKVSTPLNPAPFGIGISANGNIQVKKGSLHVLFETLVSTLYGKDSYYESANDAVNRMKLALFQVVTENGLKGAEYAGRVALFAREHMYIRTMTIVMVVELAKILQDRGLRVAKVLKNLDESIKAGVPTQIDIGEMAAMYDGVQGSTPTDRKSTRLNS